MSLSDNQKETEPFRYPAVDTECAILLFDADGVIKYSNPEIINYLSIEAHEIVGQVVFGLFPDFPIDEYLKQAQNNRHIFRLDNSSQQSVFEIIVIPLCLDTCNYFLMELYSVHDVNEKLNKFKDVSEFSNEAITIADTNGVIEYANPVFMELTGFSKDQVIGHTHSILKSGIHEPGFYLEMWATLLAGKSFRGQFVNRRPDGTLFYEDKIIRPFYNTQGVLSHFISSGRDVSDKVRIMHRLEHLANHDCLTGLPNRNLFLDRLHQVEARGTRNHDGFAIVILDLDGFKKINDTFGHAVGDVILQTTAYRIRQCLREEDTVARLGGDEFSLILAGIVQQEEVVKVMEKIVTLLNEPVYIDSKNIPIQASIGIALYPDHGANGPMLLKHADSAMYQVKISGGNNFRIFEGKENEYTIHSLHKHP